MITEAQYIAAEKSGRNLLMRRGCRLEDAEDAVQDAALSTLKTSHPWDGRATFQSWFCRVVINARLQQVRRKYVKQLQDAEPLYPDTAIEFRTGEDYTRDAEIRAAVDRLPETMRAAIVDHYFMGIDATEMAKSEGVPSGTMKSRIYRARQTLKQQLCSSRPH